MVGSPWRLGPLKRVIGEEAGIGADSGNWMIAEPSPSPTIAFEQKRRASTVAVVAASFPIVQTGSPVVCREPWRSYFKVSVLMIGGSCPDSV